MMAMNSTFLKFICSSNPNGDPFLFPEKDYRQGQNCNKKKQDTVCHLLANIQCDIWWSINALNYIFLTASNTFAVLRNSLMKGEKLSSLKLQEIKKICMTGLDLTWITFGSNLDLIWIFLDPTLDLKWICTRGHGFLKSCWSPKIFFHQTYLFSFQTHLHLPLLST